MEDLPVATLRPTGGAGTPTPINFYYVHADHLGSPRAVTRLADNSIMWQWDNLDPFGNNAANENPSGQGALKYSLRFPGQYYDFEVGTNYNYFRDYDPAVGRYEQSDPLRLDGGINTYGYVHASPVRLSDPFGLALYCRRPLSMPGGNVAQYEVDQLHHEYICTGPKSDRCGGLGPSGSRFGSPGVLEGDSPAAGTCVEVPDANGCFTTCVSEEWSGPIPNYNVIPIGKSENCQTYSRQILKRCIQRCPTKAPGSVQPN